jgi:hypothetical protein
MAVSYKKLSHMMIEKDMTMYSLNSKPDSAVTYSLG